MSSAFWFIVTSPTAFHEVRDMTVGCESINDESCS